MRSPDRRLGQSQKGQKAPQDISPLHQSAFEGVREVDSCDVVLPPPGQLRVRRIISRSRTIPTGKYPSVKLERWTHWESEVECNGQRLVDVCPAVLTFGEQPLTVHFEAGGQRHKHVPDLILRRADVRPTLIEFKSDDDEKLEEARQRAALLRPCLYEHGFNYILVLGSTLTRDAYLKNAAWLRKFAGKALPLVHYECARRAFDSTGSMSLREFLPVLGLPQVALWTLSRLILSGRIAHSMKEPMNPEKLLRWVPSNTQEAGLEWLQAAFNETL
jgi:hypothetical protein